MGNRELSGAGQKTACNSHAGSAIPPAEHKCLRVGSLSQAKISALFALVAKNRVTETDRLEISQKQTSTYSRSEKSHRAGSGNVQVKTVYVCRQHEEPRKIQEMPNTSSDFSPYLMLRKERTTSLFTTENTRAVHVVAKRTLPFTCTFARASPNVCTARFLALRADLGSTT